MNFKKLFSGPVIAILFGVAVGSALILFTSNNTQLTAQLFDDGQSSEEKIALAQCLTDKGVTFYGAFWCPHCATQRAAFGKEATELINYVECSNQDRSMTEACEEAGIESYPTWELTDGSRVSGVQKLSDLAEYNGCAYGDYVPSVGAQAPEVPDDFSSEAGGE